MCPYNFEHGGLADAGRSAYHERPAATLSRVIDACDECSGLGVASDQRGRRCLRTCHSLNPPVIGSTVEYVGTLGIAPPSGYDFGYENRVNACPLVSAPVR